MKVRKVLAVSLSLYIRNCWRLVPPAVVLAALPALPILLLPGPIGEGIAALLALPIMFVLQALHVVESAEVREGRPRPIWKSLAELRPSLKRLVLMMILAFVRFVVYLLLFVMASASGTRRLEDRREKAYLVLRWVLIASVDSGGRPMPQFAPDYRS